METRQLGTHGPSLSVVGLGCNAFGMRIDEDRSRAVVDAAVEAGVTYFDTAEGYANGLSEEYLGRALRRHQADVVIGSKFLPRLVDEEYVPGVLRRRIMEGCEGSLRRLEVDRIGLYFQHIPDPAAPVDEALEALNDLVDQGKVEHIACANFESDDLAEALAEPGGRNLCGVEFEWNIIYRGLAADVMPVALDAGMGAIPYFPLGRGLLTGKYKRSEPFPEGSRLATSEIAAAAMATDENFTYIEALTEFAEDRGHTLLELAVSWLAAQPGVASVIAGAVYPDQVRANVAAGGWKLEPADLAAVPPSPVREAGSHTW
jgi:aryl-alcohol dehydrogenase-like predicted oxidoreductase